MATGTRELAARLIEQLAEADATLALAESCTGGLIASTLTDVPGASRVFDRCLVTYADRAKAEELDVDIALIEQHGAVSRPVAQAMARGAREAASATWAAGVTGIAGPTGGSPAKPVGTVHVAIAGPEATTAQRYRFDGDRAAVKEATVRQALVDLRSRVTEG